VDQINESKYISVICDGCTDTAAIEEEIVYVRTCLNLHKDVKTKQKDGKIKQRNMILNGRCLLNNIIKKKNW
jgi:hypothetical protein